MSSENTPPTGTTRQTTRQPARHRPTINGRPLAALGANATVIAGSTLVAAGGLPALAAGAAAAVVAGGTALGGKKVAARRAATRVTRTATRAAGSTGRAARASTGKAKGGTGRLASAARAVGRRVGLKGGAPKASKAGGSGTPGSTHARKLPTVRSALRGASRGGTSGRQTSSSAPRRTSGPLRGMARTTGVPFRSARSAGRSAAQTARKAASGSRRVTSGAKRAAVRTGSALRFLRNLWRRATGRPLIAKPGSAGKKAESTRRTVNDPHRKDSSPKLATTAPVPTRAQRPTLTAHTTTTNLPHTERATHMSIAAVRMQELAEEMLVVSKQYAYLTGERGSGVGLLAYASDCAALPQIFQTVAEAIRVRHVMAEESLDVSPVVTEAQGEVCELQMKVAVAAEAAWGLLETVEAEKLSKLRNPHPNQHKSETAENAEV